ncbi:hypothetical protein G6O69_24470 [Pseudenhygromyxa sp. WMMC2535]|uniref:hypothetical protein n=1 Tax=Pseudenhygromyxa sp. WMMC2535 TaxID=2712867 RepID=UPI001555B7C1|nr:hypothetical protein [Pseudenhygromyxa sp. WMMC2535]NVB41018.1 hypothetical protein [Pseudenhygromyxa sp. WMMC2535]
MHGPKRKSAAALVLLAASACGPSPQPSPTRTSASQAQAASANTNANTNADANANVDGSPGQPAAFDPLAHARATIGRLDNLEAPIPPQCYTKTEGRANPCWTCHTVSRFPNSMNDWDLQGSYDFSDEGRQNHWTNLFADHRAEIAAITDEEILAWIREDNYEPLRAALAALPEADYHGYRPDLDFAAGFDDRGFARDGSGWRAFRYKPFPGAFWPTNGSSDDVLIRLPARYRENAEGQPSQAIYAFNLEIIAASMGANPLVLDDAIRWQIEPVDEAAVGLDLDGDGALNTKGITELAGLPSHYVGGANKHRVRRRLYPEGTEFLHSVRYVDPDDPSGIARRMKELRYSAKFRELSDERIRAAYLREDEEKSEGALPRFGGNPISGMRNAFGWQLQGFIEDAEGRLRVQTEEEHYTCMGCHSNLGVTANQSFAYPRKLPGSAGWGYQDLRGMPDVPQIGHSRGEVEVVLERALAGDEFRANTEMIARFFDESGALDREALAAAPDLAAMLMPSRARALALAKAYLVVVREQSFALGRDVVLAPSGNVHERVDDASTGLSEADLVYTDGMLQLDWAAASSAP